MRLLWVKRAVVAPLLVACLAGAADVPRAPIWSGKVEPGSGWLKRQGLAGSFAIEFTIDGEGRATGTMGFAGNVYPAVEGKTTLKGHRDPDGSAFYLFATIEGRHGLAAPAHAQATVEVTLTGFDEEDGSLQGVGTIDMADLACLNDPERSAAKTPCARRKVPVKWTAKK